MLFCGPQNLSVQITCQQNFFQFCSILLKLISCIPCSHDLPMPCTVNFQTDGMNSRVFMLNASQARNLHAARSSEMPEAPHALRLKLGDTVEICSSVLAHNAPFPGQTPDRKHILARRYTFAIPCLLYRFEQLGNKALKKCIQERWSRPLS